MKSELNEKKQWVVNQLDLEISYKNYQTGNEFQWKFTVKYMISSKKVGLYAAGKDAFSEIMYI